MRRDVALLLASSIASEIVRPLRSGPAPLTSPWVSSRALLASATNRRAASTSWVAEAHSRARARSGPNDRAKPSGKSTADGAFSSPSAARSSGTKRARPALPTCSPKRRAAKWACDCERETSDTSRSSRGISSQRPVIAARFFQMIDSTGTAASSRASRLRVRLRLRDSALHRRRRRWARFQALRSSWTSGPDISAASRSAASRRLIDNGSRCITPRTTASLCSAVAMAACNAAISPSN